MQNVHFRGDDAEDAIEAIEKELELEGFEMVEIEGEDDAVANDPKVRRIVVWEDDGWVSVADDEGAETDWAGIFASTLGAKVIPLSGDPEHMLALGEQHGIPKPLLTNRDTEDAYAVLTFRFTGEAEDESEPDMDVFGSELGNIAQLLGAGNLDVSSLVSQLTNRMQNVIAGANADTGGDAELHENPTESTLEAHVGLEFDWNCSFSMTGGELERGLAVTVSGSGLSVFAPDEMTAEKGSGEKFTVKAEGTDTERVFRFGALELHHQAPEGANDLMAVMQNLQAGTLNLSNPAEVILRFSGIPLRVGEGEYRIKGTLENGSSATSTLKLRVKPEIKLPLLPGAAKTKVSVHHAESYAGRNFAIGWLAFDAWNPTALALGKELAALLAQDFSVDVVKKGGDRVSLKTVDWTQIAPELERGANVTLATNDILRGPRIELVHQPDGPNILADEDLEAGERRPPRAVLTWSVPRPKDPAPLAAFATAAFTRAGAELSVVGGVASAQGEPLHGDDLPYESLAGTRLQNYDVRQLQIHIRSPGWRVLSPKRVPLTRSEGVSVTELEHALLIASNASDPFAYGAADATAMERAVLDSIELVDEEP